MQPRRGREKGRGIVALLGQRAMQSERLADSGRRLVTGHRALRDRYQQRRDLIDELMTDLAEAFRGYLQGSCHGQPSS